MKRKIISAAALAVVLAALALTWYFRSQAPQPAREGTSAAQQEGAYQFLLKSEKQSLELFHLRGGSWQKLAEFPLALGDLPAYDRQLLQTGLVLRDSQELQRSLEDYLPNS
jgi:hypothetical protein